MNLSAVFDYESDCRDFFGKVDAETAEQGGALISTERISNMLTLATSCRDSNHFTCLISGRRVQVLASAKPTPNLQVYEKGQFPIWQTNCK
jgi:hypothetical protein